MSLIISIIGFLSFLFTVSVITFMLFSKSCKDVRKKTKDSLSIALKKYRGELSKEEAEKLIDDIWK